MIPISQNNYLHSRIKYRVNRQIESEYDPLWDLAYAQGQYDQSVPGPF